MVGCAVCDEPTYFYNGRRYDFCLEHYRLVKKELFIKPQPKWLRELQSSRQREARRIKRDSILISLDGVIQRRDRLAFIEELES